MWFGDLVTMRWFNDVWMKEVFANFMAAKIVNPSFPEINHDLRFLYAYYPGRLRRRSHAGHQRDPAAAREPQRGGHALRRDHLPEGADRHAPARTACSATEAFRDGLREYLQSHALRQRHVAGPDRAARRRTPEDLAAWSQAWVEEAGRPIDRDGAARCRRTHRQAGVRAARSGAAPRADLEPAAPGVVAIVAAASACCRCRLTGRVTRSARPRTAGAGVRAARPAAASATAVSSWMPAACASCWRTCRDRRTADARRRLGHALGRDAATDGDAGGVPRSRARALPLESNELNVARILGYTQQAYWSSYRRRATAPVAASSSGCCGRPRRGGDASLKSAWFSALRDTAQTAPVLTWLSGSGGRARRSPDSRWPRPTSSPWRRSWRSATSRLAGDPRSAARADPESRSQGRFAFVRPALSSDRPCATRSSSPGGRGEPPPRAMGARGAALSPPPAARRASEKYIERSLGMLREIQRTGDIFFPKRWMDATLSGHSRAAAARIVRTFIGRPLPAPTIRERLRAAYLLSSCRTTSLARPAGTKRNADRHAHRASS